LQGIPPTPPSEQMLERLLNQPALRRGVAASTQNQAFNAVAFFHKDVLGTPLHDVDALRATRPVRLRHAPTLTQTWALRQAVVDVGGYPTNLVARLLCSPRSCASRSRPERMRHLRSTVLVFVPVVVRLRPALPLPRANLPAGLVVGLAGLARRTLRLRHRLAGVLLLPLLRDRSANRRQLLGADGVRLAQPARTRSPSLRRFAAAFLLSSLMVSTLLPASASNRTRRSFCPNAPPAWG